MSRAPAGAALTERRVDGVRVPRPAPDVKVVIRSHNDRQYPVHVSKSARTQVVIVPAH